jgi:hypothetical protein
VNEDQSEELGVGWAEVKLSKAEDKLAGNVYALGQLRPSVPEANGNPGLARAETEAEKAAIAAPNDAFIVAGCVVLRERKFGEILEWCCD